MNAKTHTLKTRHRVFTVVIVELADRIDVTMTCTKYGIYDDVAEFGKWYVDLTGHYDDDPRPISIVNPHSGENAMVYGDRDDGFAVITPSEKGKQ